MLSHTEARLRHPGHGPPSEEADVEASGFRRTGRWQAGYPRGPFLKGRSCSFENVDLGALPPTIYSQNLGNRKSVFPTSFSGDFHMFRPAWDRCLRAWGGLGGAALVPPGPVGTEASLSPGHPAMCSFGDVAGGGLAAGVTAASSCPQWLPAREEVTQTSEGSACRPSLNASAPALLVPRPR